MFEATGKGSAGVAAALLVGVSVLPTVALHMLGTKYKIRANEDGA